MKRLFCLLFAITLLLSGCSNNKQNASSNPADNNGGHSVYYAENVSVDKMAYYFNDVCYGSEYGASLSKQTLTKWQDPIMLYVDGFTTMSDLETLNGLLDFLNNIDGFPGIMQVGTPSQANLVVHFYEQAQFTAETGRSDADGLAGFDYDTATGVISNGEVFIRSDIGQTDRNSVILEEIYQVLGPTKDTLVRKDSIIYQRGNPSKLSDVDKSIMRLLYSERITAGMTAEQSEEVIRELYN